MSIDEANRTAVERMVGARPMLTGVNRAVRGHPRSG